MPAGFAWEGLQEYVDVQDDPGSLEERHTTGSESAMQEPDGYAMEEDSTQTDGDGLPLEMCFWLLEASETKGDLVDSKDGRWLQPEPEARPAGRAYAAGSDEQEALREMRRRMSGGCPPEGRRQISQAEGVGARRHVSDRFLPLPGGRGRQFAVPNPSPALRHEREREVEYLYI